MQETLTKILAEMKAQIDVAKDIILGLSDKPDREEAIQAILVNASGIIETCQIAAIEQKIVFSFLDHTMRYPETSTYEGNDGEMYEENDNGLSEPKFCNNEWWDSSSRNC